MDFAAFPLFALFSLSMGMTTILPTFSPSKPSRANPQPIIDTLQKFKVTFTSGSPAIWEKVGKVCREKQITFPHLKIVALFGAPIPQRLHQLWQPLLPQGTTYTPYGATECLPVAYIDGKTLSKQKADAGSGICVGNISPETRVKIVSIHNAKKEVKSIIPLPPNKLGEIVVSGDQLTSVHENMPDATRCARIITSTNTWHRMGDLGYFDDSRSIMVCGKTRPTR